eukprot:1161370-Pelagomonas_calceolata.AAC.6
MAWSAYKRCATCLCKEEVAAWAKEKRIERGYLHAAIWPLLVKWKGRPRVLGGNFMTTVTCSLVIKTIVH